MLNGNAYRTCMDTVAKLLLNLEYCESIHNSFAGILCLAFREYLDINAINSVREFTSSTCGIRLTFWSLFSFEDVALD